MNKKEQAASQWIYDNYKDHPNYKLQGDEINGYKAVRMEKGDNVTINSPGKSFDQQSGVLSYVKGIDGDLPTRVVFPGSDDEVEFSDVELLLIKNER